MGGEISFSGLVGFDTQSIVEQLMQVKRRPLQIYEDEQLIINKKREIFADITNKLSALQKTADSLKSSQTLAAKTATSSDESVLTVSANSFATAGEVNLSNISLATKSSEGFTSVVDKDAQFSSGTYFSFEVNDTTYNIDLTTLSSEDQSLQGLRNAITEKAGEDVSAVIMNTGDADDPYKLVLQSKSTGEDYQISNIDTDIQVTTSSGDVAFSTVAEEQILAANAKLTLNGISIERSSNTIDDLVEGLTINLKGETAGSVTINVENDYESVKAEIENFVEEYNAVNEVIQEQYALDEETGFAGLLSGDYTLRQIQNSLQSAVIGGVTDSEGNRFSLGAIGIEVSREDGSLTFDSSAFDEAIDENPDLALDLFKSRGTTDSTDFSYVTSGDFTQVGTYEINVTGWDGDGNVEGTFTYNGETYTGTGSGQTLIGPDGSPAEDLKIRVDSGVTGNLGELYFSQGVASKLEYTLYNFTSPLIGVLPKLDSQLESDYQNLSDQIESFELRLENEERVLRQQFLAAEEAISQLQSQQSSFESQLAALA